MKVGISSAGRFHTFDLARQLELRGYLSRLYTAYPRWKVDDIPTLKVNTFPWLVASQFALRRLGLRVAAEHLNPIAIGTFDRWMARRIDSFDIFHSLSCFAVESHQVARHLGALTICDRGSSHILYQDRILREEYRHWNLPFSGNNPRLIDREVAEYDFCDLICVPSRFTYRSFVEMGVPEAKLRKVTYGVDVRLFRPVAKHDRIFRVIYAGALSLRKGILYLLQALDGLKLPHFEVWLIGSMLPEMRDLLAKFEARTRFRYLGQIPRTDMYKYYSQGSVLVLPSIEEGLALVQAQAMACGLPVIATANTGAEDLFTGGVEGLIVPIRDSEAIREKLLYLYENPRVRDEMAAAAMRRVQALGGWGTYGEQMAAVYQAALAERCQGSAEDRNRHVSAPEI